MVRTVFSSESVTEGHPDKVCDKVSDAVLDEALRQDPNSRVACETATKTGAIINLGEITTSGYIDFPSVVRKAVIDIGYEGNTFGFDGNTCAVINMISSQSPDISQGVTEGEGDFKEQGAGDQGMMFGFATNETEELMPMPIALAHGLTERLAHVRKNAMFDYLGPDGKSQVAVVYDGNPFQGGKVVGLQNVVISSQHLADVDMEKLRREIKEYVIDHICSEFYLPETEFFINPTGRFVEGGPVADAGLTGRKIIVDSYGGFGRHGGGAFCIAGDTLINTEQGLVPINKCMTLGKNGGLVKTDVHPMPAGAWYDNGVKPTEVIETQDGYKLEATLNHNIRVIDKNGNYAWKTVGELCPGDWISIQTKNRMFGNDDIPPFSYKYKEGTAEGSKNKYAFPTKLTKGYAYLLGLLIGDGLFTNRGGIRVGICDDDMKEIVQPLFKKLFGKAGRVHSNWAYIGGAELMAYLKHLGLNYAKSFEKVVPESIYNASKDNCAAFLRGLFDTEGCIRLDGRNKNTKRIHLEAASQKLAEQVQLLLLNFGIVSKMYPVSVEAKKAGTIRKRKIISASARYGLTIKDGKSVRLFAENIGFGLKSKQKVLEKITPPKRDLRTIPNQRQRIIKLFKQLPLDEQRKDACKIGMFTRSANGNAAKELTYEKAKEFIEIYGEILKSHPEFIKLQELFFMGHYYSGLKRKIPSFAHTYDLNIPFSHTFTANGIVCHNSGKDQSKVDRSAAYAARYAAKNLVAAGLADMAEVQLAYAIGVAEPTSVFVETFGTSKLDNAELEKVVRDNFPIKPRDIIDTFDLKNPSGWSYCETAAYGHFGREQFPWEKTDKLVDLVKYLK